MIAIGISNNINNWFKCEPLVTYKVTFTVVDQDENPITDAIITFGGVTYPAGQYEFNVVPAEYNYSIEKINYNTIQDSVTVEDDIEINKTLILDDFNKILLISSLGYWYDANKIEYDNLVFNATSYTASGTQGTSTLTFNSAPLPHSKRYIKLNDEIYLINNINGTTITVDGTLERDYINQSVYLGCIGDISDYISALHLQQSTGSKQPSVIFTNPKRILFDGIDDFLYTDNNLDLSGISKFTVFFVCAVHQTGTAIGRQFIISTDGATANEYVAYATFHYPNDLYSSQGTKGNVGLTSRRYSNQLSSSIQICTFVFDKTQNGDTGNEVSRKVNNVTSTVAAYANYNNTNGYSNINPLSIGNNIGTQTIPCYQSVGEIIIFKDVLSSSNESLVYNYLATKYGIS